MILVEGDVPWHLRKEASGGDSAVRQRREMCTVPSWPCLVAGFPGDPERTARCCRKCVITSVLGTAVASPLSRNFHAMEMLGGGWGVGTADGDVFLKAQWLQLPQKG